MDDRVAEVARLPPGPRTEVWRLPLQEGPRSYTMRRTIAGLAPLLVGLGLVAAQEKSVKPGINDPFKDPDVPTFLGKFEVESREIYVHRAEIVKRVGLKP